MSFPLEYYYERELRYVRNALAGYMAEHPNAASALRIHPDRIDDPAVQMLIDGFALLNARTARKLDDGQTDVLQGLLNVLYPDYLRPLPSMMVAQFQLDHSRATQTEGVHITAGTRFETEPVDGETCKYRTCWPVQVLPVTLGKTEFLRPPFPSSGGDLAIHSISAMGTRVSCLSPQTRFADLNWSNGLQFFMEESRGDVYSLAEFFFRYLIGVGVRDPATGAAIGELSADAIEPVGFESDRGILGYSARSFAGYGALTDLFVYSLRYSFFNLRAGNLLAKVTGSSADIVFYFSRPSERLESTLSSSPLRLGCCPLVNLYTPPEIAFPFDPVPAEMPVVVDWDQLWQNEIYSVDKVSVYDPLVERTVELQPLYSQQPGDPTRDCENVFWTRREYVGKASAGGVVGSDVFLSAAFTGEDGPAFSERAIYRVEVTAVNRDVPTHLPSGEGRPQMFLKDFISGIKVGPVTSPTRTLRPSAIACQPGLPVSHLNLNHVSLLDAASLKSLLYVYQLTCGDDPREDLARRMIQSLTDVKVAQTTERVVVGGRPAFVRGQQVTLQIDSSGLPPGRAFLFAAVLAQFLSRYGTINSFVTTSAVIDGKEVDLTWNKLGTRMVR